MIDQTQLAAASQACLDLGIRVLQGFRMAHTDEEHVAHLLRYMNPGHGERWLDIGCGFGEPARLMRTQRPDLQFTILNNNAFQLAHAPKDMPAVQADMHALPFADAAFDGAMLLYTICHADDLHVLLRETRRVVRPGGSLFVFDYERVAGDNDETGEILRARFPRRDELIGWDTVTWQYPCGDDTTFRRAFGDHQELYDRLFCPLKPFVWKAR